jgi:tetratricopeptide (TPR) repeat protein
MLRYCTIFFIFLTIGFDVSAQIKRANFYYTNGQYVKAIPLYKKSIKGKNSEEAIEKLAHSYRLTQKYREAAHYYSLYITKYGLKSSVTLYYVQMLMNSGNYKDAAFHIKNYKEQMPEDPKAQMLYKSVKGVDDLLKRNPLFLVSPLSEINSRYSDFAPVIHPKGLIFISEQLNDYVERNKDVATNSSYPFILLSERSKGGSSFKKPIEFANINSDFHNGPVSFNSDFNFIVFNRTGEGKRGKAEKPKLFTANIVKNKWTNIKEFDWNSNDYGVGHPALTPDGKYLFFASDMPGGYGGKDIYFSEKIATGWSKPQNLGPAINTSGG